MSWRWPTRSAAARWSWHGLASTIQAWGTDHADYFLGLAAAAVGASEQAVTFLAAAAAGDRTRGRLLRLGQALLAQAGAALLLGQADLAGTAAEEAGRQLAERGLPLWAACAQAVLAVLAGRRGDAATADELTVQAERVMLAGGVPPLLAQVQLARGTTALGTGRYEEACEQLARIFDPADTAYHPQLRAWALVDLAEAASHAGYQQTAHAYWAELVPQAAATGSPLLRASLAVAAPMLATGDAEALFDDAFRADLAAWPLHRARLHLAYGMWLRRRQQAADSRAPLRAARDTFDALGAAPWAQRARDELRASGERSRQPAPPPRAGPAGPARTADRPAGRRRAEQPGNRPAAVPVAPDHQQSLVPDLPQTGHHLASRARRRRGRPRSGVGHRESVDSRAAHE